MGFMKRLFGNAGRPSQGERDRKSLVGNAAPLTGGPLVGGGPPDVELVSYTVAYQILPHGIFNNVEKINNLWRNEPDVAGHALYQMACQSLKTTPDETIGSQFRAQVRELEGHSFYILEYPAPGESAIPAPYLSCIHFENSGSTPKFYILGQSPMGDTTLRSVTGDGMNMNLGPGPEPAIDPFLRSILDR